MTRLSEEMTAITTARTWCQTTDYNDDDNNKNKNNNNNNNNNNYNKYLFQT